MLGMKGVCLNILLVMEFLCVLSSLFLFFSVLVGNCSNPDGTREEGVQKDSRTGKRKGAGEGEIGKETTGRRIQSNIL